MTSKAEKDAFAIGWNAAVEEVRRRFTDAVVYHPMRLLDEVAAEAPQAPKVEYAIQEYHEPMTPDMSTARMVVEVDPDDFEDGVWVRLVTPWREASR